ncbi:hypothetical protein EU99_0228 [Prochlorococcus marinus str. MIT 9321]|uniref:Uncharacterized protein n=1 Tax=Prochlorococcus marinus str. MIT 9401 TaxID=167551 RepID=A0A0A2B1N0_PROMR|nr:YadA C-terminal domain-containing protein [Prochlorococcus marinus]KGG05847.1 hypothetical protein EU99_0228 [Prochlorococcus marinus str. MIT 9321]KGG06127.1 hypothetical protein EV00_0427 [Prochlorococcus marinus str. MIT 9322]KGG06700.1 hypothetical protein EV01_1905 [Prochlorococcus marinus str. MIT 9401]
MKKFVTIGILSSSFIMGWNSVKADTWDHWAIKASDALSSTGLQFYTVNSATGEATLRTTKCFPQSGINPCKQEIGTNTYVDPETGKFFLENADGETHSYDLDTDTWTNEGTSWKATYTNSSGSVYQRLSVKRKSNGEIHIGDNSWITKEENGRQKVYAKDANGNPIPIDYTNGTKLLINGRDVEQSINNVGALSAALTGLPAVPTDTTLACGLGTGTHGGDFAFSGGCASKVNEKLSINYAASMTMPGQDYAGDFEDTFSARAGFVWKLGKSVKPSLISMKDKQKLTNEITDLKSENKILNKKITKFQTEKLELLARLERLEKIAINETNSKDLATIKLP